jgi:succinate dehydrogenase/fumarate reductase flavoprotein subunit
MSKYCGKLKTKKNLIKAKSIIENLKNDFTDIELKDKSSVYNTELISYLELKSMINIAYHVILCMLSREESRGVHKRTDFFKKDDKEFKKNSLVYRSESGDKIIFR